MISGACRVAGGHPCFRRVEFVAAQQQRFRASPRVPARREFAEPRVLANPVEIDPQRRRQFAQRSRQIPARCRSGRIADAQFLRNVCVRHRLVDHRQQPLRKRERLVHLPARSARTSPPPARPRTRRCPTCSIRPPSRASQASPAAMSWRSRNGAKPRARARRPTRRRTRQNPCANRR